MSRDIVLISNEEIVIQHDKSHRRALVGKIQNVVGGRGSRIAVDISPSHRSRRVHRTKFMSLYVVNNHHFLGVVGAVIGKRGYCDAAGHA